MLRTKLDGEDDASSQTSMASGTKPDGEPPQKKLRSKKEKKNDKEAKKRKPAESDESKGAEGKSSAASASATPAAAARGAAAGRAGAPWKGITAKSDEVFTPDQFKVITIMLKLILNSALNIREISAVVFDVILIPAASPLAIAMSLQGKRYGISVQEKGHGLDSPHLYIMGAMLDCMATQNSSDLELKTMLEKYEAMNTIQRNEWARMCRLVKIYEESQRKVVLSFGTGAEALEVRCKVLACLDKIEGAVRKTGKAPAANLERQLGDFLRGMMT